MMGGHATPCGDILPPMAHEEQFRSVHEQIKTLQTMMKQQQTLIKLQGEEIATMREAMRKITASPVWTSPNKDEDM